MLRVLFDRLSLQCDALLLMRANTQKLTTAAVCTALAVIMCVMTAYLPLSFMPLYLAAFCIFLACKRGSLPYGLLCAAASVGLMFWMTGLTVKWLTFVLIFAPYGILAFFLHRFGYLKLKHALIRLIVIVLYFNLTVGIVYIITVRVMSVGIDGLDLAEWASRVGGYAVLAVIATAVLTPLDFIFSMLSVTVLKKLPAPVTRIKLKNTNPAKVSDNREQKAEKLNAEYDIFGYEINSGPGGSCFEDNSADAETSDKNENNGET